MESCPAKTVIAGSMGFAMGGAFGLFMSSVRFSPSPTHQLCGQQYFQCRHLNPDELRHAPHPPRSRNRKIGRSRTAPERVQRHGLEVVQFGEKLWVDRGYILRDGVLYRRGMNIHSVIGCKHV